MSCCGTKYSSLRPLKRETRRREFCGCGHSRLQNTHFSYSIRQEKKREGESWKKKATPNAQYVRIITITGKKREEALLLISGSVTVCATKVKQQQQPKQRHKSGMKNKKKQWKKKLVHRINQNTTHNRGSRFGYALHFKNKKREQLKKKKHWLKNTNTRLTTRPST